MSTTFCPLCMLFSVILSIVIIPGKAKDNQCGTVTLVTEKLVENGTVKIEYRPSSYVMTNKITRSWARFVVGKNGETLELNAGTYTEKNEQHYKYVLTIYSFNVSMNGQYRVYCDNPVNDYTDAVTVNLPEPPSAPVIIGLQDIENCRQCIVGKENKMIALACEIHGGTRPLTVTMTIGNESYTPQELDTKTYMETFLVKNHHHMKNVIFSVINDALLSPLSVTAQMFVIKPPVIQFNISGSTLNISKGERAHIKCIADSVPASNISWIEELSNENITKKQCDLSPICVLNIDTGEISNRHFVCQVHYKTKVDHKYLTVHIIEKAEEDKKYNYKEKTTGQESDKSIIWIILGAGVLLVVIIVIVVLFVVIRKKSQTLEDKREGRVHHHTQEGHARCTIQKSEDRQAGNQNEHVLDNEAEENRQEGNLKQSGNRIHDDDDVPIYSQPVKKKTTENPDNIYAQVNKTRKSASSPSSANSSKVEKDGQLLYADLAFDPNAAPSKGAVAKQEDSPTEYVDIDYVKTKANKEINDDPTDQENL